MSPSARISTVTPVEPALLIDKPESLDWSESADVLVIGWGAAGACAAIEARSHGASVLVIDRFDGGGASTLSGGVVYAGGGTPYQQEAGFSDTPEAMARYLAKEVQGAVSEATIARFCADSVANLRWLEDQGLRFDARMPAHKTSYPPKNKFLYYSGNEQVPAYHDGTSTPAPRGHRTLGEGQSGKELYTALRAATLRAGAVPLTQTAVRRLVRQRSATGEDGPVLGVQVWALPPDHPDTLRHAQLHTQVARWRLVRPAKAMACRREAAAIEQRIAQPRFIRALRAVVLTTGGFIYNPDMMAAHAPQAKRGWPVGAAGCDGSGIRLGQSVGAQTRGMDNVSAWRFITPPSAWPRGLVVNTQGARFCNEEVYGATLGHEMITHHGGRAWLILDKRLRAQATRQCLWGGLWAFQSVPALTLMWLHARKAPTVAALAARIGADPQTLQNTLDQANAAAQGQSEDPVGKSVGMRHAMPEGPYFALDISIGSPVFPLATLTLGGLVLDENEGLVCDAQGAPIAGLYAAGRAAVGLASGRYVSGLSLADCVFSGRRAGKAAASGKA